MAESKDDVSARIATHTTQISGRNEPQRIPYFAKMNSFFVRYKDRLKPLLSRSLSENDTRILDNFAESLGALEQRAVAQRNQRETEICLNRGVLDLPTIASMLDQFDTARERELSNRYRSVLARLSKPGQSAVMAFVDSQLVPHMSVAVTNRLTLYTEFPELLETQLYIKCSGDMAAVQKANEELERQLGHDPSSPTSTQSTSSPFGVPQN